MSWFIFVLGIAMAQDSVKLEVVHTVYAPKKPSLVLHPQVAATILDVKIRCGTVDVAHSAPAEAGRSVRIDIPVDAGRHSCSGSLHAEFYDGTAGDMPLQFSVVVQQTITLRATANDIDLEARQLQVHMDQPASQIALRVYGESGRELDLVVTENPTGSPVKLSWKETAEKVIRLQIMARTMSELSATLDLFPWSYQIPHEDVVFPTGSSVIPSREAPKLEDVMTKIGDVMRRFNRTALGFEVPMALYLAGFTDTVGNRIQNQQLSTQRAKSLGLWFRKNGFSGPIHYQGFGENGLAIQTADEVDEAANRRAVFIIAADTPPNNQSLPGSNWIALR